VNVTVLGSNAAAPARTNPASGYLVSEGPDRILLDAGPGTFMRLAERIDPTELSGVVVSHIHVDHCADVFALYAYLAFEVATDTPVTVVAPAGTRDRMARFVGAGSEHVFHRVLAFEELAPGESTLLDGFRVSVGEAVHPVPAFVTRIEVGGEVLAYSGDTGPGGDLIEYATGASTLLCEAAIQGLRTVDTYPHHMTALEAGEVAAAAAVDALVLTHLASRLDPQISIDQASGAYVGPISYAGPGRTFAVRTTE